MKARRMRQLFHALTLLGILFFLAGFWAAVLSMFGAIDSSKALTSVLVLAAGAIMITAAAHLEDRLEMRAEDEKRAAIVKRVRGE